MTLTLLVLWLLSPHPGLEHWRLVDLDDSWVLAHDRAITAADYEDHDLHAAWYWTPGRAPHRLGETDLPHPDLPLDRARLRVRVDLPDPRQAAHYRLVAAPLEMWREVPETLLPYWIPPPSGRLVLPHDPKVPWRLRLHGPGGGSWWLDLPAGQGNARLGPRDAHDLAFDVTGPDGALAKVFLRVFEGVPGRPGGEYWSFHQGADGRLEIPALPPENELTLTFWAPEHIPAVIRGHPGSLPERVELERGVTVHGRFLDVDAQPLADVGVRLEAAIAAETPMTAVRTAHSQADGTFELTALPPRRAVLLARREGFAALRRDLEIDDVPRLDLGDLVLEPGAEIELFLFDDRGGEPVAGAAVDAGLGRLVHSDADGVAVVPDVDPSAPLRLHVTAEGYLPRRLDFTLPREQPIEITLTRAFVVYGRFVDAMGQPVNDGTARIHDGNRTKDHEIGPDGSFELALEPDRRLGLELRSPKTAALRLSLDAGFAGERRDLGEIRALAGLTVHGRLLSETDGGPVAGARIWLPRPSASGELMAWVRRDLLETTSDADGFFRLSGLPQSRADVRIDAPAHARVKRSVAPPAAGDEVDLGEILLLAGSTVRVEMESPPETSGALARLDLGNRWLELDFLTASVDAEGSAVFHHVPPGRATLSVAADGDVLCEDSLLVEGDEVEALCRDARLEVYGRVTAGGVPAGPGNLVWRRPGRGGVPAGIMNVVTRGGLRQQSVFRGARPEVTVEVGEDGRFSSSELASGPWEVRLLLEGSLSEAMSVEIPRAEAYEVDFELPGRRIAGTVIDEDSRPVEGARIEVDGRMMALSRADGSFVLTAVEPGGTHLVRARRVGPEGDAASAVVEVAVPAAEDPPPVELVLGEGQERRLEILVQAADGQPAAAAFVFVDDTDGAQRSGAQRSGAQRGGARRILTADAAGRAGLKLEEPLPDRLRFAVFGGGTWYFGAWRPAEELFEELPVIALEEPGALILTAEEQSGRPTILAPGGWDVGWLLTRIGVWPELAPGQTLTISGLPEGVYGVGLGESVRQVTVQAGEEVRVELD